MPTHADVMPRRCVTGLIHRSFATRLRPRNQRPATPRKIPGSTPTLVAFKTRAARMSLEPTHRLDPQRRTDRDRINAIPVVLHANVRLAAITVRAHIPIADSDDSCFVARPATRIWLLLEGPAGREQKWTPGTAPVASWPVVRETSSDAVGSSPAGTARMQQGGSIKRVSPPHQQTLAAGGQRPGRIGADRL